MICPGGDLHDRAFLVYVLDIGVLFALPGLVPAGVDQLGCVPLGGVDPPSHGVAKLLPAALLEQLLQKDVVAQQHIEALVYDRRVVELFDGVPGPLWG